MCLFAKNADRSEAVTHVLARYELKDIRSELLQYKQCSSRVGSRRTGENKVT